MTTGDDGEAHPAQVHVSELLAAHGRTVVPSGRRRRRAEPAEVTAEPAVGEPTGTTTDEPSPAPAAADAPASHEAPTLAADPLVVEAAPEQPSSLLDLPEASPVERVVAPVETAPVAAGVPDDAVTPDLAADDRSGAVDPSTPAPSTPAPGHPAREWALVGAQLVGALVGGAALWFGFRWLWEWQSVVAFVLAAVVIVGLVVVVRVLRRAEDMFSTMLAVLVGLIVTVSPPVLTLTGG